MSQIPIATIMDRVDSFPAFPATVGQLLQTLDDPDASAREIEGCLKLDPGLTGNVLKLCNSAYFGFQARIGSVQKAVAMLGVRRLRQIALASCIHSVMDRPIPGYDLPAGELYRHSIAVSFAAEAFTKVLQIPNGGEAFTAALLHDIGKVVLGAFVDKEMVEIQELLGNGISFESAERQVLGTDHAEVGAMLLEKWSFPAALAQAVRWHHQTEAAPSPGIETDVVHAANTVCLMIGIGLGREGLRHDISREAVRRLGLKPHMVEGVASQTLQWIAGLEPAAPSESDRNRMPASTRTGRRTPTAEGTPCL